MYKLINESGKTIFESHYEASNQSIVLADNSYYRFVVCADCCNIISTLYVNERSVKTVNVLAGKSASISFRTKVNDKVYIRNVNNCIDTSPLVLTFITRPSDCNTIGTANSTVSGGQPPYSYLWSNGATTPDISANAGSYTCVVSDSANATITQTAVITSNAVSLTGVVTGSTGVNGAINLSVSGGLAPYTYLWSNGATTQDLTGLAPGAYSVTVTDNDNCTSSISFNVAVVAIPISFTFTTNGIGNIAQFYQLGSGTVDWGDGVTEAFVGGNTVHNYANTNPRTITVTLTAPPLFRSIIFFGSNVTSVNIDNYPTLQSLAVQGHKLTSIPNIANNTVLQTLNIDNNLISGTFPVLVNSTLNTINASANLFTGSIPTFSGVPLLNTLNLSNNSFSGVIPSFATNTALISFLAAFNQISGSIPSFANNTLLQTFSVDTNMLTSLSDDFALNTALKSFIVSNNQISATLPTFATNTQLTLIVAHNNNFTGGISTIPPLVVIYQANNNLLSGIIPSLTSNTVLNVFDLRNNSFTGFTGGIGGAGGSYTYRISNNALTQIAVDLFLSDFKTRPGLGAGDSIQLDGVLHSAPSAAGVINKGIIQATGAICQTN